MTRNWSVFIIKSYSRDRLRAVLKSGSAVLVLALSCFPLPTWALPRHSPVPGGVAVIPLGIKTDQPSPKAMYDQTRVMVVADAGQWVAIVGIPLSAKPGEQRLELTEPVGKAQFFFKVTDKQYQVQHITIENKRMVDPNPEDVARISKEKPVIDAALAFWRDSGVVETAFVQPAEGGLSSNFGSRRVFNNQPRAPHSGIDIAASIGTPVKAPAAGTVLEVGNYFFNGNTVFIDHGQGLVSMFCHLDRIDAKAGQAVKAGDLVGAVGKTGRATGPHLHWTVSLNNARIDPQLFLVNMGAPQPGR